MVNCQYRRKEGTNIERSNQLTAAPKRLASLWFFLGLSAVLTWTVWLWPISNRFFYISFEGWRTNFPLRDQKLLIGNIVPGLLALVWARCEGKQQLGALLSSLFAWRTKLRWYVLAIALPCGVFLTSMCVVLMLFSEKPSQPHVLVLVNSLFSLPFGPLWEEIAWRAFALRKLQCHYSRLAPALIIGVYWALWHIPLWWLTLKYLTPTLWLIICVNVVSLSVIFAFFYNQSGQSLPVVILLHSAINTVQILVFAAVSHGTIYIIPIAAALSLCLAAILARKLAGDQAVSPIPARTR